jgi:signal transduction histidine kinase
MEVIGRSTKLLLPPERQDEESLILARLKSGQYVESFETIRMAKDGRRIAVSVTMSPLRDGDGRIIGASKIFRDITERKALEAQLRQAQKMEAVAQLAAGVAHDFNNVLVAILMNLGLLQNNPSIGEDTRESLREVEKHTVRATNLTRQLLLFSRQQAARIGPVELNSLITDLLVMLRRLLGENIEISLQGAPEGSWINADAGMMEQIVMNLCINARDAMSQGGLLTIGTSTVEIPARQGKSHPDARPGRFVCLTIADTGCGMDETLLPRIFEPFFTTKEVGKGTGLGLATVYGIARQHGGWVEVESTVGKGSVFRVYIPGAGPVGAVEIPAQDQGVKGGAETLLLVEDEVFVRRTIALSLRRLGYAVLEAGNGAEALAVWKDHHEKISLLFTDTLMPGNMTGLDLAAHLRKEKESLKIISSSGYRIEPAGGLPPKGPPIVYLPKPYAPITLARTVRDCLDKS